MGTVTHGSKDWLIDSGASNLMTRFKECFVKLSEHNSPHKVKLGDDYQYPIKGSGESSYKLDSGKSMKMKDFLFVLGLKKNLLSISALDAKGMRVESLPFGGRTPSFTLKYSNFTLANGFEFLPEVIKLHSS